MILFVSCLISSAPATRHGGHRYAPEKDAFLRVDDRNRHMARTKQMLFGLLVNGISLAKQREGLHFADSARKFRYCPFPNLR
jgi:hypothetical protein